MLDKSGGAKLDHGSGRISRRRVQREGYDIARCTVARFMRTMGIQCVIRGKPTKTTVSDKSAPCPLYRVHRQFFAPAPNILWLSYFTYVATWQGFVYVAFVIDALEQALHDRRPVKRGGLVHHSDRGSQYVSIRYSERLAEAGIEPSVGSVGDSYDCECAIAAWTQGTIIANGRPSEAPLVETVFNLPRVVVTDPVCGGPMVGPKGRRYG